MVERLQGALALRKEVLESLLAEASCLFHSYTPVTRENIEVKEGAATEVDFSLQPTVILASFNVTQFTATSPPASTITPTPVQAEAVSTTPLHQPIQPMDFRHHHFSDMEIFLRRYANEYPKITHLYSVGKSVELRELYVMEISDNPGVHEAGKTWKILFNESQLQVTDLSGVVGAKGK